MKRELILPGLIWVLKVGLGLLLAVAGALKYWDAPQLATEIANYRLLPDLAPFAANTLPMIEMVVGAALIVTPPRNLWLQAAAICAAALMAAFVVATAHVVDSGIDITCGCFGESSGSVTTLTTVRNIALTLASVALLFLARRHRR